MRGKIFHLYDFGLPWEHGVRIASIAPAELQGSYPRQLEATGMRPPEDWERSWGLASLINSSHECHVEALDPLGDDYDAHAQSNTEVIHARFAALAKTCIAPAKSQIARRQPHLPSALTSHLRAASVKRMMGPRPCERSNSVTVSTSEESWYAVWTNALQHLESES